MWVCLSLLLTLCLLHGGGAESDGGGSRCQLPPDWKIGEASKMDSLRQKLENQGLESVSYMVINHQGEQAQRLHSILEQRLAQSITLHKQDKQQPDVWQKLNGEKDDFLIYDRCGRLTYHISLPYSIIGHGHIEDAIKDTYCKRICGNCTYESSEIPEACKSKMGMVIMVITMEIMALAMGMIMDTAKVSKVTGSWSMSKSVGYLKEVGGNSSLI
ncbi:hypothetical protein LDENG_00146010 [Lucifuga dentata]|nr:hypothetical protein LDENG_00146010 [Lucifuga dentata]